MGKRTRISKKHLKHDALLETTATATRFLEDHLSKVLIGLAAVVIIVIAVIVVRHSHRVAEEAAAGELAVATQTMSAGMYAQAAEQLRTVQSTYPGTRSGAAATVHLGSLAFQQGLYDEALSHYDSYLSQHRGHGPLDRAAQEGRAAVFEQRRDFAAAAAIYEDLADQARRESQARARYLMAAARNFRSAAQWNDVVRIASLVIDENADTAWEEPARMVRAEAQAKL